MAAHILRVLNEFNTSMTLTDKDIRFALDHAPACDALNTEDWEFLSDSIDNGIPRSQFRQNVRMIIHTYLNEFFKLECPKSHEEWMKTKHNL